MKHSFIYIFFLFVIAQVFSSCNVDEQISGIGENKKLSFNISVQGFDTKSTTRAGATFAEGATLYIIFGGINIHGTATFNDGKWSVSTSAPLPEWYGTCSVTYIDNPSMRTSNSVTLSPYSGVYSAATALYRNSTSEMSITAILEPMTSRIRFKGTAGNSISVSGLNYNSVYNPITNSLSTSTNAINLVVQPDGYTPYIYATLDSNNQILVENDGIEFTRTFNNSSILRVGESGWLDIPTRPNHKSWVSSDKSIETGVENGHEWIDLGLSVKWATCNIGAARPEEYGDYYAWGEISPKEYYNYNNYKWCNGSDNSFTKYCTTSEYGTIDNKEKLEESDDAAYANWGGKWRMPTEKECNELIYNCTWTWTTLDGIEGYNVTAKNGMSIFFPAGGFRNGRNLYNQGMESYFWTNELSSEESVSASLFGFSSSMRFSGYSSRGLGYTIRPVFE